LDTDELVSALKEAFPRMTRPEQLRRIFVELSSYNDTNNLYTVEGIA
jgi:hypothetical protein